MRTILNDIFVKFLLDRREIRILCFLYYEVKVAVVELVDFVVYALEALSLVIFLIWEKVVKDLHWLLLLIPVLSGIS
jgi:hypothetical protein